MSPKTQKFEVTVFMEDGIAMTTEEIRDALLQEFQVWITAIHVKEVEPVEDEIV